MPSHRASRQGWFGRGRTRAILSLGLLLGMGAVATSAYFSDQVTVAGVQIESGPMHIDVGTNDKVKQDSIAWPGPSLLDIGPGVSKSAMVKVTNNSVGPVTFSYDIEADATGALGGVLQVTVYRGGTENGTSCSGGVPIGSAPTPAPLDTFDQPAGVNLAPTQFHNICIQVTRPATPVPPALPGGSTSTITFRFPATQVQ